MRYDVRMAATPKAPAKPAASTQVIQAGAGQAQSALIGQFFEVFRADLEAAAASSKLEMQAFRSSLFAEAQRNPDVLQAIRESPESVLQCCSVALQNGWLVGATHGQAYLVPRNTKTAAGWKKALTLMSGYKGLLEQVKRCEGFIRAGADVVYEEEMVEGGFSWDRDSKPVHPWRVIKDRSDAKIVAAYAWIERVAAGRVTYDVAVLDRDQILDRRDRSDGWRAFTEGKIQSTPWSTDFGPMSRKCPIRALIVGGTVPIRREVVAMVAEEDLVETGAEVIRSESLTPATRSRVAALEDKLSVREEITMPAAAELDAVPVADTPEQAAAKAIEAAAATKAAEEAAARQAAIEALVAAAKAAKLGAWRDLQLWLQDEVGRSVERLSDLTAEELVTLTEKLKA
jgi:recombinational DNA repair protein RecT